jgi:hypothetical protein
MSVARGEERAVYGDWEEERRACHELLAVDVPSPRTRREGSVDARVGRRHTHHAEEGAELDLEALRSSGAAVELPDDHVLGGRTRDGDAPRARDDLVDLNHERLAGPRPAHLDRAGERMPEPLQLLTRPHRLIQVQVPPGIGDIDAHGVPRIDAQHRLEVARELALQVVPLERNIVDHRMRPPSTS